MYGISIIGSQNLSAENILLSSLLPAFYPKHQAYARKANHYAYTAVLIQAFSDIPIL
jgi:hypothetical protein